MYDPWHILIWRVRKKQPLLLLKDCIIIKDFKLSLHLPEAPPGFLLGWNWKFAQAIPSPKTHQNATTVWPSVGRASDPTYKPELWSKLAEVSPALGHPEFVLIQQRNEAYAIERGQLFVQVRRALPLGQRSATKMARRCLCSTWIYNNDQYCLSLWNFRECTSSSAVALCAVAVPILVHVCAVGSRFFWFCTPLYPLCC